MDTSTLIRNRELSPFENRVLELLCEGKTNASIAAQTSQSEKVIENTISRAAKVFGVKRDHCSNLRILLSVAYRLSYGDKAYDNRVGQCRFSAPASDGTRQCTVHTNYLPVNVVLSDKATVASIGDFATF